MTSTLFFPLTLGPALLAIQEVTLAVLGPPGDFSTCARSDVSLTSTTESEPR